MKNLATEPHDTSSTQEVNRDLSSYLDQQVIHHTCLNEDDPWQADIAHRFNREGSLFITFTTDPNRGPTALTANDYLQFVLKWQKQVMVNHLTRHHPELLHYEYRRPQPLNRPSPRFENRYHLRRVARANRRFCNITGTYSRVAETQADWNQRCEDEEDQGYRLVLRGPYRKKIVSLLPDLLVGVEETKSGALHAHALQGPPLRSEWAPEWDNLWRTWFDVHGAIYILPVDVDKVVSATSYVTKAVDYSLKASLKDIRSWDPDFSRECQSSRRYPFQSRATFFVSRGLPQM